MPAVLPADFDDWKTISSATRKSPTQIEERSEALSPSELDRYGDAGWAMHDAEVQRRFHGKWVVAFQRKVIAHGTDPNVVLDQACQTASGQNHRLVFCATDQAEWLSHATDMSADFARA